MITRRDIRANVMQAVFSCYISKNDVEHVYDHVLKEVEPYVLALEAQKGIEGDLQMMKTLFYETVKNEKMYDDFLKGKANNWELSRIAWLDRVLIHLAICEVLNFEDIPVKVTMNEYLEIAKQYSTPKSNIFINGILDKLFQDFKDKGLIIKKGRGLID